MVFSLILLFDKCFWCQGYVRESAEDLSVSCDQNDIEIYRQADEFAIIGRTARFLGQLEHPLGYHSIFPSGHPLFRFGHNGVHIVNADFLMSFEA